MHRSTFLVASILPAAQSVPAAPAAITLLKPGPDQHFRELSQLPAPQGLCCLLASRKGCILAAAGAFSLLDSSITVIDQCCSLTVICSQGSCMGCIDNVIIEQKVFSVLLTGNLLAVILCNRNSHHLMRDASIGQDRQTPSCMKTLHNANRWSSLNANSFVSGMPLPFIIHETICLSNACMCNIKRRSNLDLQLLILCHLSGHRPS